MVFGLRRSKPQLAHLWEQILLLERLYRRGYGGGEIECGDLSGGCSWDC